MNYSINCIILVLKLHVIMINPHLAIAVLKVLYQELNAATATQSQRAEVIQDVQKLSVVQRWAWCHAALDGGREPER